MKGSSARSLLFVLACAPAFGAACVGLPSDRIRVADLLGAVPALEGAPPDLVLGYSPAPGATRVVRRPELAGWLQNLGLPAEPASLPAVLCLERSAAPLTRAQVENALIAALHDPGIAIRIADFSHFPIPASTLEFPLTGLSRPSPARPDAPVLWLGHAVFDGGRKVTVWATVGLWAKREVLVAAVPLEARTELTAGLLQVAEREVFPFPDTAPASPEQLNGKALRRPVAAGSVITPDLLMDLPAVRRGELASVTVEDGLIRIVFDAKADSNGARGDSIVLENPVSGRKFRGRIAGRRQVLVDLSGS